MYKNFLLFNEKRNLLFTSAGDNTNFDKLYVGDNMDYDIYVIYYGNNEENYERYKSKVKFIEKRKGSKFQNFKYFYDKYREIIDKYEYYFILDDDIILDVDKINRMFIIAREYNLLICAPAFVPGCKITHPVTRQKKNTLLTYTNFVEVNTPLFNRIALINLMKVLDSSLIGCGIDFLYIWCNGLHKQDAYAIIHSISCVNPHDYEKKDKRRELLNVPKCNERGIIWRKYANKIGCPANLLKKEYKNIKL